MKKSLKTGLLSLMLTLLLALSLLHPSFDALASDPDTCTTQSVSGNTVEPNSDRSPDTGEH